MLGYYDSSGEYHYSYQGQFDDYDDEPETYDEFLERQAMQEKEDRKQMEREERREEQERRKEAELRYNQEMKEFEKQRKLKEEEFKNAKYNGKIDIHDENGYWVGTKERSKDGKRIEIYDNCGRPIGYEDVDKTGRINTYDNIGMWTGTKEKYGNRTDIYKDGIYYMGSEESSKDGTQSYKTKSDDDSYASYAGYDEFNPSEYRAWNKKQQREYDEWQKEQYKQKMEIESKYSDRFYGEYGSSDYTTHHSQKAEFYPLTEKIKGIVFMCMPIATIVTIVILLIHDAINGTLPTSISNIILALLGSLGIFIFYVIIGCILILILERIDKIIRKISNEDLYPFSKKIICFTKVSKTIATPITCIYFSRELIISPKSDILIFIPLVCLSVWLSYSIIVTIINFIVRGIDGLVKK